MKFYVDYAYGRNAEKMTIYLSDELANDLRDWLDLSGEDFTSFIGKTLKNYVAKHKDAIEEYRAFTAKYRKGATK